MLVFTPCSWTKYLSRSNDNIEFAEELSKILIIKIIIKADPNWKSNIQSLLKKQENMVRNMLKIKKDRHQDEVILASSL